MMIALLTAIISSATSFAGPSKCAQRNPPKLVALECAAAKLCRNGCSPDVKQSDLDAFGKVHRITIPLNEVIPSLSTPPVKANFQLKDDGTPLNFLILKDSKIGEIAFRANTEFAFRQKSDFEEIVIPALLSNLLTKSDLIVSDVDFDEKPASISTFEIKKPITLCEKVIPANSRGVVSTVSGKRMTVSFKTSFAVSNPVPSAECTFDLFGERPCEVSCGVNGLVPDSAVNMKAEDVSIPE